MESGLSIIFLITVGAILVLLIFFASGFVVARLRAGSLPKAALQQSQKNAFFTGLILAAILGILLLIVGAGFGQPLGLALFLSCAMLLGSIFFFSLFLWFRNRLSAGRLLLDISPIPDQSFLILSGIAWLALGFTFNVDFVEMNFARYVIMFIGISLAIQSIILATTRLQLRETGILLYINLVKWRNIEAYEWDDSDTHVSVLKLRFRGRLPTFLRNGVLPVPLEKKEEVKSLLDKYLPELTPMRNRA